MMAGTIAKIGAITSTVQAIAATVQAVSQAKEAFGDNVEEIHDEMLVNGAPEPVIKRNGPDIKKFGTLRKQLGKILDWLTKRYDIKGIGIHGTPGIGKTTIMSNLNDHDRVAKMFDIVIWLKVSKEEGKENLSREHLLYDIAQRLKLKMGGTRNVDEVSQRISMVLEGKRYLLLLDDVKGPLELREIGIPDSNNGSKIVLTTRQRPVCKLMNLDKEIKVEYLPMREAWEMFQDVLGNQDFIKNPNIGRLAIECAKSVVDFHSLLKK